MSINPLNDISRVYLEKVAVDEATAMAKRGADETAIRQKIASNAKAGKASSYPDKAQTVVSGLKAVGRGGGAERLPASARGSVRGPGTGGGRNTGTQGAKTPAQQALAASRAKARSAGTLTAGEKKQLGEAKKGDGNLANNYPPYDKVTRGDVIAGATGKDQMGGKKKKKVEEANDGNLANNYPPYDKVTRGDVIAGATGNDEMGGKKKKKDYQGPLYAPHPDIKKAVKEGFSDWRQDLSEVMDDETDNKKIKEKKIQNKIKINPKLGEALEELGGTLLEMVEIDEFDFIVESAYDELLEEGYDEDLIEEALEYALTEAKVTMGHDTSVEKKRSGLLDAARKKLAGAKKAASQAVASGARKVAKGALGVARKLEGGDKKPSPAHTKERKAATYRGAGVGTKERVGSGSYTPPAKKKAEKPADPWEGSATTPPKAKTKKAAAPKAKAPAATPAKRKRKSKLDDLLASVRSESVQMNEAGDWWHPDPEKDKMLPGRGPKLRAKEDRQPKPDYSNKLKPGETYYQFSKRKEAERTRKEEVEIDEKLNLKKSTMGDVIRDFYKSKAPQFKGRSKEKRREMAIAAKLTAERGGRKLGEQLGTEPAEATPTEQKPSMLDKQKIANLKMLQQKKQVLDRQKLQMQKAGKLPLEASYQPEGEMVDEGKQSFPFKKVEKQMAKARAGSVYAKKGNPAVPNTTDAEKKETTRFSKMFHASEKAKREKQNAAKASRSSTFYKDTHPASAPKMKKANEEFEVLDERRAEDRGTPRKPRDPAFELVAKSMGAGRLGVQPRGVKKQKGAPTPGPVNPPARKVAMRRRLRQQAQDMMHSPRD